MTDHPFNEMVANKDILGLVAAITDHDYEYDDPRRESYIDSVKRAIREIAAVMGAPFWTEAMRLASSRHRLDGVTIFMLIECADQNTVDGWIPLLAVEENRSELWVDQAAFALGRLKDRRATAALLDLLVCDTSLIHSNDREKAAEALGEINDPSATDALVKASTQDSSDKVRRAATHALEKMGDPRMKDGVLEEAVSILSRTFKYERDRYGILTDEGRFFIQNIGQKLNKLGGMEFMRGVFERIQREAHGGEIYELDKLWDGIGEWRKNKV